MNIAVFTESHVAFERFCRERGLFPHGDAMYIANEDKLRGWRGTIVYHGRPYLHPLYEEIEKEIMHLERLGRVDLMETSVFDKRHQETNE